MSKGWTLRELGAGVIILGSFIRLTHRSGVQVVAPLPRITVHYVYEHYSIEDARYYGAKGHRNP